jgi:hypothetical protein
MKKKNVPQIFYELDCKREFKLNYEAEFKLDEMDLNIFAFVFSIPEMKKNMNIPIMKACRIFSACSVDGLSVKEIYDLIETHSDYLAAIVVLEQFVINGLCKLGGDKLKADLDKSTEDPNLKGDQ